MKQALLILIGILCAKAIAITLFIVYGEIGLGPDEAQYWTWSQHLDWGYYSKPPGIAWEIWAGTSLFGNTAFGVRFGALVIGTALPIALFFAAKAAKQSTLTCLISGLCLALSPLGILSTLLAITDGGMVLFWTLACIPLLAAISEKREPNYLFIGLLVLLGALFKWPTYAFWLVVVGAWILCPWMRTKKGALLLATSVALSLIGLLPSAYWNMTHDWATFRHVFATVSGGHTPTDHHHTLLGNPLEFFGAQAMLVSPLLFIFLLMAWTQSLYRKKEMTAAIQLCAFSSLAILGVGFTAACMMKMQGNWLIFAYPMAFLFLAWYLKNHLGWLTVGIALSVAACSLVLTIPSIQSHSLLTTYGKIPYKINPFKHNIGWNGLSAALTQGGYNPDTHFLFGDQYQMTSILSFYGPTQKKAYFLNLREARNNQFFFWPGMQKEQKGKTGYFVVVENVGAVLLGEKIEKYLDLLRPYFTEVNFVSIVPLFRAYDKPVKFALICEGVEYNGKSPPETLKY